MNFLSKVSNDQVQSERNLLIEELRRTQETLFSDLTGRLDKFQSLHCDPLHKGLEGSNIFESRLMTSTGG